MAYKAHAWVNGELITAEKLNALEAGAAQAAQPGPKGDKGDQGEKGDTGEGLTGTAEALAKLATDADLHTVTAKVNELIDVLMKRGICSGGE